LQSGKLFSAGTLLQNPILGVMLGSLFTAMIHSSSTTTSVVVGMVGADVLDVK
jgi:sodium-dependent phosphate cotransporter